VCGDFNDTPISYTYSTIKEKLADAFKESGIGIGNSYVGIPSLRIDYILHDKKFNSYNYKKNKYELSDHFPISCSILIP
jgi:endonuclease/exonuclease/phosphatase family metal-dependent hydrolase